MYLQWYGHTIEQEILKRTVELTYRVSFRGFIIIFDIFHSMVYCVQVLYTTNQETSAYLGIPWIGNAKSIKIDNIHKRYVLCLKLEYFFKSCKT